MNSHLGDGLGGVFAKYGTQPLTRTATTRPAGNVAGLFPVIGPSPSSQAGSQQRRAAGRYPMSTASDVLPLGAAGSQVAGLILLATGVLVTLLRFRRRRGTGNQP